VPLPEPAPGRADPGRVLVIACGALARELVHVVRGSGLAHVEISCLPASLHQRPAGIPAAVERRIARARGRYERIFVAYADCGTGGRLDAVLEAGGVERLPGAHCYEVFAGSAAFARLADEEPGTFYLTDFLARHFERLVIAGLGIDRHPELLPVYFGNYRRVVYLSQAVDADLLAAARAAAQRLGLDFRHEHTGYGAFAAALGTLPAAALPAAASRIELVA
jgi:hypothetical protein